MSKDDFKNILSLASAIGNVLQAINKAEKNNLLDLKDVNINYLLNQKNSLETQLQAIYNAYINLKNHADEMKKINKQLVEVNKQNEKEIMSLKEEISSLKNKTSKVKKINE